MVLVVAAMSAAAGALGYAVSKSRATDSAAQLTSAVSTADAVELQTACRTRWSEQVRVAFAADAVLDQWQLHLDAMNQFVAGDITLDQLLAFWKRSQVAAEQNVDFFAAVDRDLRSSTVRCRVDPYQRQGTLGTCAAATSAFARALMAARTAVQSWEHHMADLVALQSGGLTAEAASDMWSGSSGDSQRELRTYADRTALALNLSCP